MQAACFTAATPQADRAGLVGRINALAQQVRPSGFVVWIQHTDALEGFARDSDAWRLLPELQVEPGDHRIEKEGSDAFLETDLDTLLRGSGATEVIIVGYATEFCVDTTVRAAASKGYRVIAPSDGHTTDDRPDFSARDIIRHHNYVWSDLLLPRRQKIRVVPTAALLPVAHARD